MAVGALGAGLAACGAVDGAAEGADYPERIVLADRSNKDSYHPASGYSQTGISPVCDGLLRPSPDNGPDQIPALVPALADGEPRANADSTDWTVKLRRGVTFSDGSEFDAQDVKATYDVARDSDRGSEISYLFDTVRQVEVVDPHTVSFDLTESYRGSASSLNIAIARYF